MSTIEIQDLTKSYGETPAIRSLSLVIPDGTFCVILGPSGCGKSTTLNCIAGLEDVTSGAIRIDGRDVTRLPPHARNVAVVFQSSLLYPHLTSRQNILMSLRKSDLPGEEVRRRVAQAVSMLHIEPLLEKKPAALSGGERQRVAMAKAIVREPAVFLMDEPLAALDAALRQSLRVELAALQRKLGTTTVFVTHDQVEAMTMGDMIVVMNGGNVEQVGTPDEVYNRPATRFVAGFVGSPSMNFFDGRMARDDQGPRLDLARFSIRLGPGAPEGEGATALGLRPQHLRLAEPGAEGTLRMTVTGLERLGRESVLILEDPDGTRHRMLVDPATSRDPGDAVGVELQLEHGVFF